MNNLSGQILKTYRILERIGAGGFGAVYRAIQQGIEREVAIKVILPEHANTPVFVQRFETEAQLVARLEHPHIIPLYDYWREPGGAYLVMRYLRGGSLRDGLEQREKGWPPALVAQMLAQIGSALAFAHSQGVVHRDLKTDNILLDEAGNYYLGDFGIAKNVGGNLNLTADAILGTPAYLSPEQIRGEEATAQSDIYALGIVVYEALTSSRPFYDLTPATVLFKQLNEPLPDVTQVVPELPSSINTILQRATSKNANQRYPTAFDFAMDFQRALREGAGPAISAPAPTQELFGDLADSQVIIKNPYKGLRAFQQADAPDFFGRAALVERLAARLKEPVEDASFLAVVGPSGSGKSSVVKAGLLPAVRNGALDAEQVYYVIEMIPGRHPLEELETALLGIATADVPDLLKLLKEEPRGFIRAVRRILPGDDMRLLLLIDQFEEVFTLVEHEATRQHLLDMILEATSDPRSRIKIVVTLRADFYDKPLLYERFGDLVRRRTELVLPMNAAELEAAITGPANRMNVMLEPGLVQTILAEVRQQPGALPLLQYALTELFERRANRRLTLESYQEIGGTSGALARRAEDVFAGFDAPTQAAAQQMFLRLVTLGDGTEDTRRRVLQSELLSIASAQNMAKVIDTFGKFRLLTFDHDPLTRSATVEVAHEALIRRWERMRGWLDESREGLRLQRRLAAAAEEWVRSGRERSFLAHGLQLEQFAQQADLQSIALNVVETDFLRASLQARDDQLAAEKARQAREAELEKRARDRLRFLAALMTISAVVGIGLAVFAFNQANAASTARQAADTARIAAERNEAEASSLALAANARNAQVEGNLPLALTLADAASRAFEPAPPEVLRVLADVAYAPGVRFKLDGHMASVMTVAFAPDGASFLSAGADGLLLLRQTATGEMLNPLEIGERIIAAEFHPTGERIAVSLADNSVRLYDAASGELLQTFSGHSDVVMDIEFTHSGDALVTASLDRTARLWDVATGEEMRRFEDAVGIQLRLVITPDDQTLVTTAGDETIADTTQDATDRSVYVWDMATGAIRLKIEPKSGFIRAVAMHPDGASFAIGVWDSGNRGTIRFYDLVTGEETKRLFAHSDVIADIAYNADGRFMASASWDGTVKVWDIARSLTLQTFVGFPDRILNLDYSPDSTYLVLGMGNAGNNAFVERARDTSVFLIDLQRRDEIRRLTAHTEWLWATAIRPDGQMAATGSGPLRFNADARPPQETLIRLWDVATTAEIRQLAGHTNTIDSLIFLPDNERLLSGGWDNAIILWDVTRGVEIRRYAGHEDAIHDLALSPDGTRFLSASADGTVRLWEVDTGAMLQRFDLRPFGTENRNAVNGVGFSPDGTRFVTGSADRIVRVWDVATGEVLLMLAGHTDTVNETIFNPAGTLIASSSWDDSIRLWDAATGALVRQLTGHNGNTFGLAFSADGTLLLTTSQDTTMRLWQVATGDELHRFLGHSDWVQEVAFTPDGMRAVTASQDRTARLWRIDRTLADLHTFAAANRYSRPLTCAERAVYRLPLTGCSGT